MFLKWSRFSYSLSLLSSSLAELRHKTLICILLCSLILNSVNSSLSLLSSTTVHEKRNISLNDNFLPLMSSAATSTSHRNESHSESISESANRHLLELLGMEEHHAPNTRHSSHHSSLPQYMWDLYALSNSNHFDNQNYNSIKYNANIVRSFAESDTHKDFSEEFYFYFNISDQIGQNEQVLEAEFHVFQLKPQLKMTDNAHNDPKHNLLEVRLYQLLSDGKNNSQLNKQLLDVRRMSTHTSGWEVFNVKRTVLEWLQNKDANYGLYISANSMLNESASNGDLRFAKRYNHHINKQPIIVIFSIDKNTQNNTNRFKRLATRIYDSSQTTNGAQNVTSDRNSSFDKSRIQYKHPSDALLFTTHHKLDANGRHLYSNACSRYDSRVDFATMGWSKWIIAPKTYNAYQCRGDCTIEDKRNYFFSNHAKMQSILHLLHSKAGRDHVNPCCVPHRFSPLNVLYMTEHHNLILKHYDDMIVESCECY